MTANIEGTSIGFPSHLHECSPQFGALALTLQARDSMIDTFDALPPEIEEVFKNTITAFSNIVVQNLGGTI